MRDAHIHITGVVQGVGMRPFVYREAVAHHIAGWVLNAGDGVHIEAHASCEGELASFVAALEHEAPAAARIDGVSVTPLAADAPVATGDMPSFTIVASDDGTATTTLVSPDITTCPDCLAELFDPADRRYHYPFINCTNCGPRFTIIERLPYDRPATSMGAFPMCPTCAREYADPLDRRFHAQPDACFACGPHITWRERAGERREAGGTPRVGATRETSDAIIERCAELLRSGGIVALKGLGGFHLACDATDDDAVRELRRRKRRSNKPLAVMVASLDAARDLCAVDAAEAELLAGTVRPIVLLRRNLQEATGGDALASSVAFDLPEVGVMLPYTPLQHLLMAACARRGIRALVMTSGNISEEPIEIDDSRAWERLVEGGLADALLGNDRAILARYDDSVVRVVDGAALPVRRARGYAPRPLPLPALTAGAPAREAVPPTILTCGPEQKATFALTREQDDGTALCFLSQHIGDVEHASTFDAWHEARGRFEELFDLHPEALACDRHPSYLASAWARDAARSHGLPLVEVQHHHAHIAATLAEAAARGDVAPNARVIGVAFDGTGAGDDGTVWGGEILLATLEDFTRAAHLTPWRLPGGAASVRDARRSAFSLLFATDLADHPGAATLVSRLTAEERAVTRTMVERGINSPLTSSMGRLLDAAAALLGICDRATYEGEPAIELEARAWAYMRRAGIDALAGGDAEGDGDDLAWRLDPASAPLVMDTTPLVTALLDGMAAGENRDRLAYEAHAMVVGLAARVVAAIVAQTGLRDVALSGGVFMNRLILRGLCDALAAQGLNVLVAHDVPVNDGCIAYGQAAVARARLARHAGRA